MYLFLILSVFVFIFIFWTEGRRDGFDKFMLFDLVLTLTSLTTLLYIALGRWFVELKIYHYNSIFLKIDQTLLTSLFIYLLWLAGILAFSGYFTWSIFRLLDIFAVAQVFFFLVLSAGTVFTTAHLTEIIFLFPFYILYFLVISKRSLSGVNFATVNFLHAAVLLLVVNIVGRLPIALILLTISLSVVYLRKKSSMTKTSLPQDFLNFVKEKLHLKEKELQKQENMLKAEDPYLQPGRAEGNSEEMDEAILEDTAKEISDAKLNLVKSMRTQIKRALSFLKIGKYGYCEICGKPIDKARLSAYPEATRCVEHAE